MHGRRLDRFLGIPLLAALSSCVSPGDGPSPPAAEMYYPVGIAVSPAGHTLYVANSDFDLQYNAGTVMALNLDRVRALIPPLWNPQDPNYPCGALPANPNRLLYPGRCGPADLIHPPDGQGTLVAASVQIGAFATDALVVARSDAPGARLFVPVRGDPSLTWIEIDDDRTTQPPSRTLYCGQSSDSPRCDATHRAGEDPDTNLRRVVMPPEPYGVAADATGQALVVTHQAAAAVSLITNPWDGVPTMQFALGNLAPGPVGLASVPVPEFVFAASVPHRPAFLLSYRAAAELDVLRYYDDAAASPARPFLTRTAAVGITVNADGQDSRGLAIDDTDRRQCEQACNGSLPCLQECAAIPAQLFIANRTPPSLIIGEVRSDVSLTGTNDQITIYDSVPLSFGPSRVQVGQIIDEQGLPQRRVFVSCFDSRYVFIYDPVANRIDGEIRTGRGPHGLAFDPTAPLLYIAHFTDSYIGIVDLDQRHAETYGTIVLTLGTPQPPRESK